MREGSTLYLNEHFRPSRGGQEFAHYCVMVRKRNTTVALLKAGTHWNNKPTERTPFDLIPGNILDANGISVEILECPVFHAGAEDREITKFLDLAALEAQAGTIKPNAAPVEEATFATPELAEPSLVEASAIPMSNETSFEQPDRLVVPISLEAATPKNEAFVPTPEPMPADAPVKPQPTPEPVKRKANFFSPADNSPMKARENTLKRAAMVAGVFAVLIFVANTVAKNYEFDIIEDAPMNNIVITTPVKRRAVAQQPAPAPVRAPASENKVTANPDGLIPLPVISAPPAPKGPGAAELKELANAIEEGNLQSVSRLVEAQNVSPDFALDELGRSPFVRAASAGKITVMQYLLTKKVSVSATDYNGNNALMWATINGHEKTVRFLLSLGLDPNTKREDGKESFQLAREYRQASVLKVLREHGKADSRAPASKH